MASHQVYYSGVFHIHGPSDNLIAVWVMRLQKRVNARQRTCVAVALIQYVKFLYPRCNRVTGIQNGNRQSYVMFIS